MDRQKVLDYINKKYKVQPEYPWRTSPNSAVFRHSDNNKWFALLMDIPGDKVGLNSADYVDVINLKIDDMIFRDMIIREAVSVLLDGTVPENKVLDLIDMSYLATASAKKKEKIRPPKEWIIPSNPKYYDVIHAFEEADIIDWKQGAGIKKGDTVYLYVAAPYSAVMYKCKVLETDIPYNHADKYLTIKALMKIKLQKRYAPDRFTFDVLKAEYGIYAVRGPRGIPNSLSAALKKDKGLRSEGTEQEV